MWDTYELLISWWNEKPAACVPPAGRRNHCSAPKIMLWGCFNNCEKSPPTLLPSTCVSGWSLLPPGISNYVSCLPTGQHYGISPSSSCAKKDTTCWETVNNKCLKKVPGVVRAETFFCPQARLRLWGQTTVTWYRVWDGQTHLPRLLARHVSPPCCQTRGLIAMDVFVPCSWTGVGAHNCYLVWLQKKWQKMEMSKFNPCIWQAGISDCVSNTERIKDLSKHSSFSLLLAYSLPLRHTLRWEKQRRCWLSAARLSC